MLQRNIRVNGGKLIGHKSFPLVIGSEKDIERSLDLSGFRS